MEEMSIYSASFGLNPSKPMFLRELPFDKPSQETDRVSNVAEWDIIETNPRPEHQSSQACTFDRARRIIIDTFTPL